MKFRYPVWLTGLVFGVFLLSLFGPGYAQRKVLSSLEEDITSLVESIKPSLVTIETESPTIKGKVRNFPSTFVGSGIVYTSDGYILTTASVVGGMENFKVTLPNGKSLKGRLVGTDRHQNLAVLKVDVTGLTPAKLGNSDKVRVGSWLTVVGNSYGLPNAVALGLVNGVREDGFIQMSANVSPGNSGGPVLDTYGKVIGLVSAKLSEPSYISAIKIYEKSMKGTIIIPPREIEIPSSGVSLALPINKAKAIADEIIKHGSVRRGYLGIYPQDLSRRVSDKYNLETGVLVAQVVKGSPAEKAGLSEGDVIIKFAGTEVKNVAHIRHLIAQRKAGENVELKILRGGRIKKLFAVLGEAKPLYELSWQTDPELSVHTANVTAQEKVQGFLDERLLDQLQQQVKELRLEIERLNQELKNLKLNESK